LLREKFFVDALQLFFNPLHLLLRRGTLLGIQLRCRPAGQPPVGAVHDRRHHLQIADQFGGGPWWGFLLSLGFEKQCGIVQDALADRSRSVPPSGIQLAGFARIAVPLRKDRRHALAGLQALARHRHQKLHRHLPPDLALAHLLLHDLRQQFHQCQPPRNPAHAAVEPPCQLIQAVAETLLQLAQQPAHLQRGLLSGKAQRAVQ
jgi:hypothetical protein